MSNVDEQMNPELMVGWPVGDDDLAALHQRLEHGAMAAGVLDVAYRTVDTPVGPLMLASTPGGLVRVAYECEDFDRVLEMLALRVSPRNRRSK